MKEDKGKNEIQLFKSFYRFSCGNPVNEFLRCLEILGLDLGLFTTSGDVINPHLRGYKSKIRGPTKCTACQSSEHRPPRID